MTVTYICENGHEHDSHKAQPAGHNQKVVCRECKGDIIKRSVPIYECEDCDNRWGYTGDADRPTCSNCRGKRTRPVSSK